MADPYQGDTIQSLSEAFERDLKKTIEEIEAYQDERNLWKVDSGINNAAGNLALHIAGNLRHFIGKELGQSNYIRDRNAEFEDKHVPRSQIIDSLELTIEDVKSTLAKMSQDQLNEPYPGKFRMETSTVYMLIHLSIHLGYHLGQINYHRRLLDT